MFKIKTAFNSVIKEQIQFMQGKGIYKIEPKLKGFLSILTSTKLNNIWIWTNLLDEEIINEWKESGKDISKKVVNLIIIMKDLENTKTDFMLYINGTKKKFVKQDWETNRKGRLR